MDNLSALRARAADRRRLTAFFAAHLDLPADTVEAIRRAPERVQIDSAVGSVSVPYDPAAYPWSAAEVWAVHTDECRFCYEARPYPTGQRHFGWTLWLACSFPDGCDHQHHQDEVWIA